MRFFGKKRNQIAGIMTAVAVAVTSVFGVPVGNGTNAIAASKKTKTVTLSIKKATLTVGDTLNLKVTVKPKSIKAKWSSSRKSVATVSKKGVVKAKKAGTANITVKAGKKKAVCKVIVKKSSGSSVQPAVTPTVTPTPTAGSADSSDLYAAVQQVTDSKDWVKELPSAKDDSVNQMVVIACMGMDKTTATLTMHEKDEKGQWKQILTTPAYVGKYGLCADADHKEGCGQTPLGIYHFNKAFGIADDPGCSLPYTKVDDDIFWSGDPNYKYNQMVNIKEYPELAMDDSEHIIDYAYEYRYCLNISFNEEGTLGRGSAIFLHCLGLVKPYTGGCVAVPEYIMKQIMQKVKPDCAVVIDTLENMTGNEYY